MHTYIGMDTHAHIHTHTHTYTHTHTAVCTILNMQYNVGNNNIKVQQSNTINKVKAATNKN